ncbi:MAG: polysaccharide deacetylase family protein [Candidatus Nitrosotenuis sp.]
MNLLGIDFEDWFHPQLVQKYTSGMKKEPQVIKGIDKILDLLRVNDTYATFFVVGELLEYDPTLLDKIINNGHEIGFHTMYHDRLDISRIENFSKEIIRFAELTNRRSKGFRAPTFSLNHNSAWAVDVLVGHNYVYDSSVVPLKTSMYGLPNAEIRPYKISSSSLEKNDVNGKLLEFPLAVGRFMGKKMPIAGGFYLRFLPLTIIKSAIQEYEKQNLPATFYIHSWELTPEYMPRIKMSFKDSFITYHNIENAFSRLSQLLKSFTFTSFERYISQNKLGI